MIEPITDELSLFFFRSMSNNTAQTLYFADNVMLTKANWRPKSRLLYLSDIAMYITRSKNYLYKKVFFRNIQKIILSLLSAQFVLQLEGAKQEDLLIESFEHRQSIVNVLMRFNSLFKVEYLEETLLNKYLRQDEERLIHKIVPNKKFSLSVVKQSLKVQQIKARQLTSIEDFVIQKLIHQCRKCKIYLCKNKTSNLKMALKCLRIEDIMNNRKIINTFQVESSIVQKVSSPFIGKITNAFLTAQHLWLVSEFYKNSCMQAILVKAKTLSEDDIRFYLPQIILCIGHIHETGYTYNNLDPSHILIDNEGYIRMINFGKCLDVDYETQVDQDTCMLKNTSPACILTTKNEYENDWWAVGILLFQMLYGFHPFQGQTPQATKKNILDEDVYIKEIFSQSCHDLLLSLLNKNSKERLGSKNSYHEILAHPFFKGIKVVDFTTKKAKNSGRINSTFAADDLKFAKEKQISIVEQTYDSTEDPKRRIITEQIQYIISNLF